MGNNNELTTQFGKGDKDRRDLEQYRKSYEEIKKSDSAYGKHKRTRTKSIYKYVAS